MSQTLRKAVAILRACLLKQGASATKASPPEKATPAVRRKSAAAAKAGKAEKAKQQAAKVRHILFRPKLQACKVFSPLCSR